MSYILVTNKPGKPWSRVVVGSEWDRGGRRGYVLLAVRPRVVLLGRGAARRVGQALLRFAESVRPLPTRKTTERKET